MTRPLLALTTLFVLLASSEAQACWPWCNLFGRNVDVGPDEELSQVELIVSHPLALNSAPHATMPVSSSHRWGTQEIERVFDFAYGGMIGDFDKKREVLDKWLLNMGEMRIRPDGAAEYAYGMHKGLKFFKLDSLVPSGTRTLRVIVSDNDDNHSGLERASAENFGFQGTDSLTGLWARAFRAHGRAGIDEIETWFDALNRNELDRYTQGVGRNLSKFQAADETLSGQFIRQFYGFTAAEVDASKPASIHVLFRPHQVATTALTQANVSSIAPYPPIDWNTVKGSPPPRFDSGGLDQDDEQKESEQKQLVEESPRNSVE